MAGLLSLSTIDYPGLPSCVLFLKGCPFSCPFCYNYGLLEPEDKMDIDTVFQKVKECLGHRPYRFARYGLASAVVFSGGEPLMSPDVVRTIASRLKAEAKTKLDTNGFYPRELRSLLKEGLLDFVAIDFKGSPEQYEDGAIIGNKTVGPSAIQNLRRSIELCARAGVGIEIRTTIVPGMNDSGETIAAIAKEVPDGATYVLQQFTGSMGTLDKSFEKLCAISREEMLVLGKKAREILAGTVKIRTIENGEEVVE